MIITLIGANFANSNIGTLSTWRISTVLGAGATSSNSATSVDRESNTGYTTTITIAEGYELGAAGITVTMGGVDITSTAVSGLTITIPTKVTGNVVIKVPTVNNSIDEPEQPETPTTYTITYRYVDGSGATVKASETETVTAGTVKNFATTDSRATVDGYTCTSVSPTSATINSDTTVTYTYTAVASVVNLWTITDTDTLFENGIYRNTSGEDAGASNFNKTYPSSDKIYINGNTGTFSLNLEGGKTYRWQMIPYYEYGSVKLASPWSNSDGTSPGNFSGKRFWFYDASDNMIANDKAASSDGVYLMTIPTNAVYMRFMGWGYHSTNGNVPPKYSTNLMVTEGETEYTEYVAPNV